MLASIHPLGERARDRRWGVTVSAYLVGSTVAAALLGGVLGGFGALLHPGRALTAVVVVVLGGLGLAYDLHVGGLRLPTVHRQVDKDWLDRYRGWVVGVGFGVQLGLGVVTIVNTAAVYLVLVLAFLTGSVAAGTLVAGTFGLVRGLVILVVAPVRRPDQLRAVLRSVQVWRPRSQRIAIAVHAAALVAVGAVAISH